jgi:hypothetical protein
MTLSAASPPWESWEISQRAGDALSEEIDGDGGIRDDVEGAFADEVGVGPALSHITLSRCVLP